MIQSSPNPFTTDAPAEPDRFFGRKALLAAADGFLRHPDQKAFFVNGPRRIGKTSLLLKLKHEMAHKGFAPVSVDLQGKAEEPLPQVLYDIMASINAEIKNVSGLSVGDFEADYRVFDKEFLPSISQMQGKLALLFDEFDAPGDRIFLREDAAFSESAYLKLFPYLHSLFNHSIGLKIIAATGRSPSDVSVNYGPVKVFSTCEHLYVFDASDTAELIASLTAGSVRFTDAAIEEIQQQTKGHPQLVQCLAWSAFDWAEKQKLNEIDRTDVESRLLAAVEKFSNAISSAIEGVFPQERAYLILIAKLRERGLMATEKTILHELQKLGMEVTPAEISRATAGLLDSKILMFNPNFAAYSFFAPLLERWFAHEYAMENCAEEIAKADKRFEDSLRIAKGKYNEKNHAKAVTLFRALAETYPQRLEAHFGLSLALEAEGKSTQVEIIAPFEKAYRLDPDKSRQAYKSLLKRLYEKENAPPILERIVGLGDSTVEDRKKLLSSYLELWRSDLLAGRFELFQSAVKGKPWLFKEYQSEIIRFFDALINEIVVVNPYRAKDVILSLKDHIDELQLQVWRHRIESNVKKANNKTTEIHSLSQDLAQLKTFLANEKKKAPVSQAASKKKSRPIALPVGIALALLIIMGACGLMFLRRPADAERTVRAQMEKNIPAMEEIHDKKNMQNSAVAISEKAHEESAPVEKKPPPIVQKDSTNPAEPDTSMHAGVIDPENVNNSSTVIIENPIKNKARIMLINASSMHQQGLAARARKRLIERGFSSQNVLTGNNRSKVSRVYAYYSTEKYIPVLKEILAVLYPGKQKSFFDISSKDRTINGWVKDFFNDENLHILIRMPNEE